MLAKCTRLVVERLGKLDAPVSLICFCKTVVNVRRFRITLHVHFEYCNRIFPPTLEEILITKLIDDVLRHGDGIAEFQAKVLIMCVNSYHAAAHRAAELCGN